MKTFFVSSTFRDMQFERDAISEITLPKLNAAAKRYGESVSFCDLRWGIDTSDLDSDDSSKKVLDVCFDQIDRSSSPMIVILGERYGYIPASGIIEEAARQKNLRLADLQMSVTALEIEYGVFSEFSKRNALFYFREMENAPDEYLAEDAEHAAKLAALKKRIAELTGGKCRTYKASYRDGKLVGADKFAQMLADDLADMLAPEWEKQAGMTEFERERRTQENFIADRAAVFRGRERIIDELVSEIDGGRSLSVVKGGAGSGKSGVFAKLAVTLREKGYDVLPFVGGLTTESNDAFDIVRNTVYYIEDKFGMPHRKFDPNDSNDRNVSQWRARANELIAAYCAAGNRFVIALDAADKLYNDEHRHSLAFIPDVNIDGFAFFATCSDEFKELGAGGHMLGELDEADRSAVISGLLARYGRELDADVVNAILAMPAAGNPLYLGFLIRRLLMMNRDDYEAINRSGGTMTDISERQRAILRSLPHTVDEMCAVLLDEASRRINEPLISDVLALLACSRYGLRESDLRGIIGEKWNVLDFLHFVSYMDNCFMLRDDGRYDFIHSGIRDGILKRTDEFAAHRRIVEYCKTVGDVSDREVLYHIVKADDKAYFRKYVVRLVTENAEKDGKPQNIVFSKTVIELAAPDGGEWIAQTIASTPIDDNALPFFLLTQFVVDYCASVYANLDLGLKLCRANLTLAERAAAANAEYADEILQLAKFKLGFIRMAIGDTDGSFDDIKSYYERARAEYDVKRSADSMRTMLMALKVYVATAAQAFYAISEGDDEVADALLNALNATVNDAVTIAEDRYAEVRDATAACDLGYAYMIQAYDLILNMDFGACLAATDKAVGTIDAVLDELYDMQLFSYLFDGCNGIGMLCVKFLESSTYDVKSDAEMFENFSSGGARNAQKYIAQCGERAYGFSLKLCETAYKKFGTEDWLANVCQSQINYATVGMMIGEYDACENILESVLRTVAEAEKREYSVLTRAMAAKAKTLLATCYLSTARNVSKAKDMIVSVVSDADNIIASDDSPVGRNAALEAYVGLLNLYIGGGLVELDAAYSALKRILAVADRDALVKEIIKPIIHMYCLKIAQDLDDLGMYEDELIVARRGREYASERYEMSPLDVIDIYYMFDMLIYDLYDCGAVGENADDPTDRSEEFDEVIIESVSLIEAKLDLVKQGRLDVEPDELEDMMDTYDELLDMMFEMFEDDASSMYDYITDAIEAFDIANALDPDADYETRARLLKIKRMNYA